MDQRPHHHYTGPLGPLGKASARFVGQLGIVIVMSSVAFALATGVKLLLGLA